MPESHKPQSSDEPRGNESTATPDRQLPHPDPTRVPLDSNGGGLDGFVHVDGQQERPVEVVTIGDLPNKLAGDPDVTFHDVRSGETFFSICREHYGNVARWQEVLKANGMKEGKELRIGMEIVLP